MKKIIFSAFLILGFGVSSFGSDASLPGDGSECQTGGLANVNCPYWDVTYEVTSGFWPWSSPTIKVTCTTGGQFKCEKK